MWSSRAQRALALRRAGLVAGATALVLALAGAAPAEIYRWTDDRGTTRYTNLLPESGAGAGHRIERLGPAQEGALTVQAMPAPRLRSAIERRLQGRGVEVPFQRDGQLIRVEVRLNQRVTAPFYLDTASTFVSITPAVASALGLDEEASARSIGADTPGGRTRLGVVGLESIELGSLRLDNVSSTVNPNLDVGLLGGAFLNRFNYFVDSESGVLLIEPRKSAPAAPVTP